MMLFLNSSLNFETTFELEFKLEIFLLGNLFVDICNLISMQTFYLHDSIYPLEVAQQNLYDINLSIYNFNVHE